MRGGQYLRASSTVLPAKVLPCGKRTAAGSARHCVLHFMMDVRTGKDASYVAESKRSSTTQRANGCGV
jgi:hypothetical protein